MNTSLFAFKFLLILFLLSCNNSNNYLLVRSKRSSENKSVVQKNIVSQNIKGDKKKSQNTFFSNILNKLNFSNDFSIVSKIGSFFKNSLKCSNVLKTFITFSLLFDTAKADYPYFIKYLNSSYCDHITQFLGSYSTSSILQDKETNSIIYLIDNDQATTNPSKYFCMFSVNQTGNENWMMSYENGLSDIKVNSRDFILLDSYLYAAIQQQGKFGYCTDQVSTAIFKFNKTDGHFIDGISYAFNCDATDAYSIKASNEHILQISKIENGDNIITVLDKDLKIIISDKLAVKISDDLLYYDAEHIIDYEWVLAGSYKSDNKRNPVISKIKLDFDIKDITITKSNYFSTNSTSEPWKFYKVKKLTNGNLALYGIIANEDSIFEPFLMILNGNTLKKKCFVIVRTADIFSESVGVNNIIQLTDNDIAFPSYVEGFNYSFVNKFDTECNYKGSKQTNFGVCIFNIESSKDGEIFFLGKDNSSATTYGKIPSSKQSLCLDKITLEVDKTVKIIENGKTFTYETVTLAEKDIYNVSEIRISGIKTIFNDEGSNIVNTTTEPTFIPTMEPTIEPTTSSKKKDDNDYEYLILGIIAIPIAICCCLIIICYRRMLEGIHRNSKEKTTVMFPTREYSTIELSETIK